MSLIKHLYKTDINTLLDLIKDAQITKDDLKDIYELLANSNNDELIYWIYRFLDENPKYIDFSFLSKVTNIEQDVLKEIFQTKPYKVYFPIANNESADLVTAYVFRLSKNTKRSSFSEKKDLEEIKKLLKKENDTQFKDFFVIFDKNFEGNSYLLSIVAGLFLEQPILDKYAFTGIVNSDGEVIEVDYLLQKKKICENNNLHLITPNEVSSINDLKFYFQEKHLDVPFIILNKDKTEALKALKKIEYYLKDINNLYSINKVLNILNLSEDDIITTLSYLPPDKKIWKSTLETIITKLKKIYSNTDFYITLDIATSIASLSFATGVVLGAKRSYRLFHFQNDKYFPLIDLSTPEKVRKIKSIKRKGFKVSYKININDNSPQEVNFILYLASHNPLADIKNFTKNENYIYIYDENFQGNLPLDSNLWVEYVRDIYSIINMVKEDYYIDKFNLFISSPSIIAMAFGMAVGDFIKFDVYDYFRDLPEKYYKVFDFRDLKTIF